MTIPNAVILAAYFSAAVLIIGTLCVFFTALSRYGITGILLLLSADLYAWSVLNEQRKAVRADFRRQALDAMPREEIIVPVRRRKRSPSLMQRARKLLTAPSSGRARRPATSRTGAGRLFSWLRLAWQWRV